ncbi:hypothetical protein BASA81_004783 [Batrachochytrium salamandrivorans]|nr:hypothetical protein BASA81_004783 [Batrachochytrium salamandrivorans]
MESKSPVSEGNTTAVQLEEGDVEELTIAQLEDEHVESFASRIKYVLVKFTPIAIIAFGGPTAHIHLLRERFVRDLKMVDDTLFMELFGLSQALPGPSATKLVIALGMLKAGVPGGLLAFVVWSLPGYIVLTTMGMISGAFGDDGTQPDWMAGIAPAASSQVFFATWQLGKNYVDSRVKIFVAVLAAVIVTFVLSDERIDMQLGSISFPVVLLIGAVICLMDASRGPERLAVYWKPPSGQGNKALQHLHVSRKFGVICVTVWITVLVLLIVLKSQGVFDDIKPAALLESMYRIGSIIYGGGQVVLPMLQNENLTTTNQFFQGMALAQMLPGPLFNLSSFLGSIYVGFGGSIIGVVAINLPGILLTFGLMPFWSSLQTYPRFKICIVGVSSASIGLLLFTCIQLFEASVHTAADAVVFLVAGSMTGGFNVPVPISILTGALLGFAFSPSAIGLGQDLYCMA